MAITTIIVFIIALLSVAAVYVGVTTVVNKDIRKSAPFSAGLFLVYLLSWATPNDMFWLTDTFVMIGAVGIGTFLAFFLNTKWHVVGFAVAAAVADYYGFDGGLTRKIFVEYQTGEANYLAHIALFIPVGEDVQPLFALGDLVVISTLFAAMLNLRIPKWKIFIAPTFGLMLALITLAAGGSYFGLALMAASTVLFITFGTLFALFGAAFYFVFLFLIWPTINGAS